MKGRSWPALLSEVPGWSRPGLAHRSAGFALWTIVGFLHRSMGLLIRLIGRDGYFSALIARRVDVQSDHAALLEERPLRLRIATTFPRLPRALVLRRDEVERAEALRLGDPLLVFARRELCALVRELVPRFAVERPRVDVLRFVREVARVPPERLPRAEVVRFEREDVPVVRPRPVVLRAVDVPLLRRELLPRVEALRVPAERDEVPREDAVRRPEPVLRARLELRAPEPAERAVERPLPELRPVEACPRSLRRLALLLPLSRACAVSRAISLLKLLRCPSAVVS
jgi:hypothetical protein